MSWRGHDVGIIAFYLVNFKNPRFEIQTMKGTRGQAAAAAENENESDDPSSKKEKEKAPPNRKGKKKKNSLLQKRLWRRWHP